MKIQKNLNDLRERYEDDDDDDDESDKHIEARDRRYSCLTLEGIEFYVIFHSI